MSWFNNRLSKMFSKTPNTETELKQINQTVLSDFSSILALKIYKKIIIETMDRAIIPNSVSKDGFNVTVYDSYTPFKSGLASLVSAAMVGKKRVFLLKKELLSIKSAYIFTATINENEAIENGKIKPEYIELDFRQFNESTLVLALLDLLEYAIHCTNNGLVIGQAIILKIYKLSEMIDNIQNREPVIEQVKSFNDSIRKGKTGILDAQSSIDQMSYDSSPAMEVQKLIWSIISSITGLPRSFLNGEIVGGLGNGDNGDKERENLAIRGYFNDITSGLLYSVYLENFEYKEPINDVSSLVSLFTFIETSTALTDSGKLKFLVNNTGMEKEDFVYSEQKNNDNEADK